MKTRFAPHRGCLWAVGCLRVMAANSSNAQNEVSNASNRPFASAVTDSRDALSGCAIRASPSAARPSARPAGRALMRPRRVLALHSLILSTH